MCATQLPSPEPVLHGLPQENLSERLPRVPGPSLMLSAGRLWQVGAQRKDWEGGCCAGGRQRGEERALGKCAGGDGVPENPGVSQGFWLSSGKKGSDQVRAMEQGWGLGNLSDLEPAEAAS